MRSGKKGNDGGLKIIKLGDGGRRGRELLKEKEWACACLEWLVRAHIHSERKHIVVHCTLR
jgi:hypothetical protein